MPFPKMGSEESGGKGGKNSNTLRKIIMLRLRKIFYAKSPLVIE